MVFTYYDTAWYIFDFNLKAKAAQQRSPNIYNYEDTNVSLTLQVSLSRQMHSRNHIPLMSATYLIYSSFVSYNTKTDVYEDTHF